MPADDIEAIARQAQIKCLHERPGREFGCHEHIAEDADALSGNHRLDGMQLLPKAEVLHVLEFGHVAPLASGSGEPSLPGGRLDVWPATNRNGSRTCFARSAGSSSAAGEASRGLQTGQKVSLRNSSAMPSVGAAAAGGIADRDVSVSGLQIENAVGADDVERRIWDAPSSNAGRRGTSQRLAKAFVVVTRRGCWSPSRLMAAIAMANASSPSRMAGNSRAPASVSDKRSRPAGGTGPARNSAPTAGSDG